MVHSRFTTDWIEQYSDPFAVLGLSVLADDHRTLKRYRAIAKQLHPDALALASESGKTEATQLLARLVNPAYKALKQRRGRADHLATLRFKVRQQRDKLEPTTEWGQTLLRTPIARVEMVYEQATTELGTEQYESLGAFESLTTTLAELNLVYLRLKLGEPMIREKRVGVVPPPAETVMDIETVPVDPNAQVLTYAQRHYLRARGYLEKGSIQLAVRELKDAIRLDADQSDYHALMAIAYLKQRLSGAARAYCRRALSLNPDHELAQKCARRLNLEDAVTPSSQSQSSSLHPSSDYSETRSPVVTGLFQRFGR